MDVKAFFARWVDGCGYPPITCKVEEGRDNASVDLTILFGAAQQQQELQQQQQPDCGLGGSSGSSGSGSGNGSGSGSLEGNLTVRLCEVDGDYDHSVAFDSERQEAHLPLHTKWKVKGSAEKLKDTAKQLAPDMKPPRPSEFRKKVGRLLWVRVDPDLDLVRRLTVEQPEQMWANQVRTGADVLTQIEGVLGAAQQYPRSNECVAAVAFLLNRDSVYWRCKAAALHALARMPGRADNDSLYVNGGDDVHRGLEALLEWYRKNYMVHDKTVADASASAAASSSEQQQQQQKQKQQGVIPQPTTAATLQQPPQQQRGQQKDEWSNKEWEPLPYARTYGSLEVHYLQREFCGALAEVRDARGWSPAGALACYVQLLRASDNAGNRFAADYLVCAMVRAASDFAPAPEARASFAQAVCPLLQRRLALDRVLPSHSNAVAAACVRALARLAVEPARGADALWALAGADAPAALRRAALDALAELAPAPGRGADFVRLLTLLELDLAACPRARRHLVVHLRRAVPRARYAAFRATPDGALAEEKVWALLTSPAAQLDSAYCAALLDLYTHIWRPPPAAPAPPALVAPALVAPAGVAAVLPTVVASAAPPPAAAVAAAATAAPVGVGVGVAAGLVLPRAPHPQTRYQLPLVHRPGVHSSFRVRVNGSRSSASGEASSEVKPPPPTTETTAGTGTTGTAGTGTTTEGTTAAAATHNKYRGIKREHAGTALPQVMTSPIRKPRPAAPAAAASSQGPAPSLTLRLAPTGDVPPQPPQPSQPSQPVVKSEKCE